MSQGLQLNQIVPWGRSLHEYQGMFNLSTTDLQRRILDCAGGPASFTAEMHQQGGQVIACDPIYQFSVDDLRQRIQDTYAPIVEGVRANQDRYVWTTVRSPEHLGEIRWQAMQQFLVDFPTGLSQGRYQAQSLPHLTFGDRQFDLALCGHLLFTYDQHLSLDFHLQAIQELSRVAQEVRIFPIVSLSGDRSPLLPQIQDQLSSEGYRLTIQPVNYEFQRGGNQLLQITQRTDR